MSSHRLFANSRKHVSVDTRTTAPSLFAQRTVIRLPSLSMVLRSGYLERSAGITVRASAPSSHHSITHPCSGPYSVNLDGAIQTFNGFAPDPGKLSPFPLLFQKNSRLAGIFQEPLFSSTTLPQGLHTVSIINEETDANHLFLDIDFVRFASLSLKSCFSTLSCPRLHGLLRLAIQPLRLNL